MSARMRVAGIMSGTSLDGIDVAVVDIDRGKVKEVVAHRNTPYPAAVRKRILAVSNAFSETGEISRLNFLLPELYAKAVRDCGVPIESIHLIGCHGQTIFHESGRNTLQIGDGCVLRERTGIPVVSDFRPRDIAAGGKGAPLVPFADYLLFRDRKVGRIALNIGGIANFTAIPAGARADQVLAFDTGPGNMIMDQLVAHATGGKQAFDKNGSMASRGRVLPELIEAELRKPYYRERPPKTAGREQYGREFVDAWLGKREKIEDLLATATALTAATIASGVHRFAEGAYSEIIVAGGGARNRTLMGYLAAQLPDLRVRTTDEFGIDIDAKEAVAFAIMAYETWHQRPSNLPSATGASHPVVLGKVSY